jgi:hypothetical protein
MDMIGSETGDAVRQIGLLIARLEQLAEANSPADRRIIIAALCFLQHGHDLLAQLRSP